MRYGLGGEKESCLLEKRLLCRSGIWKGGVCGMVWPRGRRVTAGSWLLMSPHHPRHHTAAQTPPSSYHQTNPAPSEEEQDQPAGPKSSARDWGQWIRYKEFGCMIGCFRHSVSGPGAVDITVDDDLDICNFLSRHISQAPSLQLPPLHYNETVLHLAFSSFGEKCRGLRIFLR